MTTKYPEYPLIGTHVLCSICRKDEELHWNNEVNQRLTNNKMCFTCDHWAAHYERNKNRNNVVIINGVHYLFHDDDPIYPQWSGFGGQKFIIHFHDGRKVVTRNLWCQGHISPQWISKFPDNAVFVGAKV